MHGVQSMKPGGNYWKKKLKRQDSLTISPARMKDLCGDNSVGEKMLEAFTDWKIVTYIK